jgi:hypothetical protein
VAKSKQQQQQTAGKIQAAWLVAELLPLYQEQVKSGKESPITLFAESREGGFVGVVVDGMAKQLIARLHQATAQVVQGGAVLVSEAWAVDAKAVSEEELAQIKSGAKAVRDLDGRRREVLTFNCIVGSEQHFATFPIDRERGELGDPEWSDTLAGRFALGRRTQ